MFFLPRHTASGADSPWYSYREWVSDGDEPMYGTNPRLVFYGPNAEDLDIEGADGDNDGKITFIPRTVHALTNVLSTVRAFTKGKVWVVFGAGGDRDRAKRPLMGAAAARWADHLVVTSDNPRSERPEDIIAEILAGIPAGTDVAVEPDRRAAINLALARAAQGDTVVVCGKGHETTQTIGTRVLPFDDRIVCAEY